MIRPLFFAALAFAATSAFAAEVKVYLLAGQSNMQGLGKVSGLTAAQKAPAGIFFWRLDGKGFEPLRPGKTITASKGEFGPEVALALELAKAGEPAYLVKSYRGGTGLDAGWNDQKHVGGTGPGRWNFYPGTGDSDPDRGLSYIAMIGAFRAALADIRKRGDTPVVQSIFWMQGEQDTKTEPTAAAYAKNLKRLRDRVEQDLGLSRVPFIFGQVAPYGDLPGEKPEPKYIFRKQVRAAQAACDAASKSPEAMPLSRMVSTNGFTQIADHVHYDTDGQLALGKAFHRAFVELTAAPAK